MRSFTTLAAAASVLAGLLGATPTKPMFPRDVNSAPPIPAVDLILGTMPDAAKCDMTKFPQCTTAETAAPHFVDAMMQHGIYNKWEIAAVLSLTAMESASLKYKQPASLNDPDKGKGTSNMQSSKFNFEFAQTVIPDKVKQITQGSASPTADQSREILKLLQDDEYNFQTGAWFMARPDCQPQREKLVQGTYAGWLAYVEDCVGVKKSTAAPTEWAAREKFWNNAMTAFKLTYTST